ncbi:RteC domain-containing protein [Sphingobacterium siyangense]|uniref:RteC protein n=1 Tax=Sphingobacterium siyangense TaxID=459529 RepID=A0A562M0B3_9SPHI|nr:RteC domain-containing protein [Sphingobacterium siyangense]TWI13051.1 RteC protein [Sphingobacterium siyangense]
MNKYFHELVQDLDNNISELNSELGNTVVFYETVINITLAKLREIKEFVLQKGFLSLEEEIEFFKRMKPLVVSKLIYYNGIYKIEAKRPYGGDKIIKKYLDNELNKLKRFFDNNLEFYKYYRTNSTYLDHKYFVRGNHDIKLSLDTYYFESDQNFSTSHDFKISKIIANDLIQIYIEDQLYTSKRAFKTTISKNLNWTGSKTALTELIYALHAHGVVDSGNIDIKILAKSLEQLFNIDLGDIYHTFFEIRNRKIKRTKFLDSLNESLTKKMDEQNEK